MGLGELLLGVVEVAAVADIRMGSHRGICSFHVAGRDRDEFLGGRELLALHRPDGGGAGLDHLATGGEGRLACGVLRIEGCASFVPNGGNLRRALHDRTQEETVLRCRTSAGDDGGSVRRSWCTLARRRAVRFANAISVAM